MQIYIVTLGILVHVWWFWVQLTVVHHWLYINYQSNKCVTERFITLKGTQRLGVVIIKQLVLVLTQPSCDLLPTAHSDTGLRPSSSRATQEAITTEIRRNSQGVAKGSRSEVCACIFVYLWVSFCVLITIAVRTSLAGVWIEYSCCACQCVELCGVCLTVWIVYPALSSAGNQFLLKVTFPHPLLFLSHWLSPLFSEALGKMKDVYEKNPQMGDPASLASQINQTSQNIERLRGEVNKYEVIMTTVNIYLVVHYYREARIY